MFKRIKENPYIQKFLELWQVPRYRSLIILGLYIIFFVIVISSIKMQNSNNIKNISIPAVDIMTNYKNMDNYQYNVTIKNDDTVTLSGKVYKNNQTLLCNDNNYYITNNKIYIKQEKYIEQTEKLFEFDIWKFNPVFISNLIEKGIMESKTEFSDGIIAKSYLVPSRDFIKEYFGDETTSDDKIKITVYQNDKRVTKIELDISTVYHIQQYSNQYDYLVTIEYEFIDEIDPIIINLEG